MTRAEAGKTIRDCAVKLNRRESFDAAEVADLVEAAQQAWHYGDQQTLEVRIRTDNVKRSMDDLERRFREAGIERDERLFAEVRGWLKQHIKVKAEDR